jgi:hypothetical protein
MTKQMWIRFDTNKNGQRLAHRWSPLAARYFRIGLDEAELMVSTGQAIALYPVARPDGRIVYVTVPNN